MDGSSPYLQGMMLFDILSSEGYCSRNGSKSFLYLSTDGYRCQLCRSAITNEELSDALAFCRTIPGSGGRPTFIGWRKWEPVEDIKVDV